MRDKKSYSQDNSTYALGIDLGSSSVKLSIVNLDTEDIEDHVTRNLGSAERTLNPNFREQSVPKIVNILNSCMLKLDVGLLQKVTKIGVCCHMHGVVFWAYEDDDTPWKFEGEAFLVDRQKVSHLFTWEDTRCNKDFLQTLPKPDSHLGISSGFGIATTFWILRNKPHFFYNYNRSGLIGSFIVAMMCDESRAFTSYQNATSWGYFNCRTYQWNKRILRAESFPIQFLPKPMRSGEIVGVLAYDWCGLRKGIPVSADMGNLQCAIISSIDSIQDAVLNFSDIAQIAFILEHFTPPSQPAEYETIYYWPYFETQFVGVATSLNGDNVLTTFVNMLMEWMNEFGHSVDVTVIWNTLLELAEKEEAMSDLQIKPTCLGERFAPHLTGAVSNITGSNLGLGKVFRALCVGLMENLHNMLPPRILQQANITRIVGRGAKLYRNNILRTEIERLFELPAVIVHGSEASKGAALAVHQYGYHQGPSDNATSAKPFDSNIDTDPGINDRRSTPSIRFSDSEIKNEPSRDPVLNECPHSKDWDLPCECEPGSCTCKHRLKNVDYSTPLDE